jgi:hypothetical protein
MGEVYVSLIAFLVSGAVIVVACHIGISIEHHKTTFERWTTQAQTRIRGVVGITAHANRDDRLQCPQNSTLAHSPE